MRVVAGNYRSRPLKAVPGKKTRPTTDKIKEAMFNLIATRLPQKGYCLDFYAGSGALAIEAVSRGLASAVLCERDRQAIMTINENIQITKEIEKFQVLRGNNRAKLLEWSLNHSQKFDLVFLDPPYAKSRLADDLVWLTANQFLQPGCLVVCESDEDHHLEELKDFKQLKEKQYGITIVQIIEFKGE